MPYSFNMLSDRLGCSTYGWSGTVGRACIDHPASWDFGAGSYYANGSYNFILRIYNGLIYSAELGYSKYYGTPGGLSATDTGSAVLFRTSGISGQYSAKPLYPFDFKGYRPNYYDSYIAGEKYTRIILKIHNGQLYGVEDYAGSQIIYPGYTGAASERLGSNIQVSQGLHMTDLGTSLRIGGGITGTISYYVLYGIDFSFYNEFTRIADIYYSLITLNMTHGLITNANMTNHYRSEYIGIV